MILNKQHAWLTTPISTSPLSLEQLEVSLAPYRGSKASLGGGIAE